MLSCILLVLVPHILESLVQLAWVGRDLVLRLQVLVHHSLVDIVRHRCIDLQLILIEFLDGHSVQREGSNGGVGVFSLIGHVGDEETDVLFQLSKVKHNVVLIEDGCLIVLVVLSH